MTAHASAALLRRDVLDIQAVAHGSATASELAAFGLNPTDVLDFSVNTNPLGPADVVVEAIQQTNWSRYPGDDEAPLRAGLAHQTGVTPEQVALGNGSLELLWLLALATLERGDRAIVVGPTFGEYARAARVVGADVLDVQCLVDVPSARMVFICNPNNPTGSQYEPAQIEQLLRAFPETVVVLDEAYAGFVLDRWQTEPLLAEYPNLVILRSLTKDHALPGLRLGYLLASPEIARATEAVRPPWSVNAGALRAGLATLEPSAQSHVHRARTLVAISRTLLTDGFTQLGYRVLPSVANFVLVEVGNAPAFRSTLLPYGLVVRDATSFGLPDHARVACRLPEHCSRLLEAVADLRRGGALPLLGDS
jgi:histidinol-phosphate aminotransferase